MRYERVKVKRDTNTVHNRAVPPWEIPVLEFLFEEGNVEPQGEFEEVAGEYPEANVEFNRLTQCFGSDPQSGTPYVAAVYGNAGTGIRALRKAIADAKTEDEEAGPVVKSTPAPVTRSRRQKESAADSLLG